MTNTSHEAKVDAVARQVRAFYERKQQAKIYHGATNSTRPISSASNYVDVSGLTEVVAVNTEEQYALVEPNVPLDKLIDATTKHGLIPPVVAEFPGITVGGAVQGGSGESSSFKQGTFHDTCLEYEIVLGDGSRITASRTEHADLFWGMSCAYGSLGVLTLIRIRLIPAAKYVKLRYYRTTGHADAVNKLKMQCKSDADFVDGILFSPDKGVIVVGTYTNEAQAPKKARFTRAIDEWFYLHVERLIDRHDSYEEVVPLKDYLFRYDRGGFWVAKYGFKHVPFNRLTRLSLASLFKTRTLFKLVHGSNYAYLVFAQDICLPEDSVVSFLEYADEALSVYPLWLCPLTTSSA